MSSENFPSSLAVLIELSLMKHENSFAVMAFNKENGKRDGRY